MKTMKPKLTVFEKAKINFERLLAKAEAEDDAPGREFEISQSISSVADKFQRAAVEPDPRKRAQLFAEASAAVNTTSTSASASKAKELFEMAAREPDARKRARMFKEASDALKI
jgi:hypothetical protein